GGGQALHPLDVHPLMRWSWPRSPRADGDRLLSELRRLLAETGPGGHPRQPLQSGRDQTRLAGCTARREGSLVTLPRRIEVAGSLVAPGDTRLTQALRDWRAQGREARARLELPCPRHRPVAVYVGQQCL